MGDEVTFDLEQWLHRGALAARRGDVVSARRIFRALSRLAPHERRVWIGLARVAETAAERDEALRRIEHILPVEAAIHPNLPPTLPVNGEGAVVEPALPPRLAPAQPRAERQPHQRKLGWLLPAILLLIAAGLLAVSWWQRQPVTSLPPTPFPTTQLPPTLAAIGPLPTPLPGGIVVTTPVVPSPSPPPPTPSPLPTPSPEPNTRTLGQLITYDQWQIGLLRREDVVVIDGELGAIRPAGRFLIALLAVSNEAPVERVLPANLFAVEDESGQRYAPLPGASRQYLDQFGRGLYGDLALEDAFAPQSGLRSVPVLFDLPANRAPVRLWAGGEGWPLR